MKKFVFTVLFLMGIVVPAKMIFADPSAPKSPRLNASAEALAIYPAEIRNAILTVLQYPQVLQQIADLQKKSSAAFQALLNPLPRKTQEQVWELVKYPNLLNDLSVGEKGNLKNYPKEIDPAVKDLLANHPDILTKASAIDDQPNREFQGLIQGLPAPAQAAFQKLLQNADILIALGEYLNLRNHPSSDQLKSSIQQLTAKLQSANNPTDAKLAAAPGDDPKVMAALQKSKDQMDTELNKQIDQDPYPAGAKQVNMTFDPYPWATGVPGFYTFPYWWGWPAWSW